MNRLLLLTIVIFQLRGTDSCLPKRTKGLTGSYIPICIQVLYHYKMELKNYYPYTFTPHCRVGSEDGITPSVDVCVDESLCRINELLNSLRREAEQRNLDDFQGFTPSILNELEKVSQSTSIQQFRFILTKLGKEEFEDKELRCKIVEFIQDLDNPHSKFYRNLLNVKPLNYLDWR